METLSEENYLKSIYNLGKQGHEKISPTVISQALNNNPASVVDMIKKLKRKKLIHYEKSKGVKLTDKGKATAISVIRNHRLWEVFLLDKLHYKWDEVHSIAEQLEHVHSPELAERLDKYLGFPQYDPHGDPIPKSNGEMPRVSRLTVWEMKPGKLFQIVGIKDSSAAFLHYLQKLNIKIGTQVKMLEKIDFDGSVSLQIGGKTKVNVSKQFAGNVLVDEVNEK
jgi:DtxR family Mn-dependent transcriptional regulator